MGPARRAAAAFSLAAACAAAHAGDVMVAGPGVAVAKLRAHGADWEAGTAHRITWLADQDDGGTADLVVTDLTDAREMAAQGLLAPIHMPTGDGAWSPPVLFQDVLQGEGGALVALPIAHGIPVLRADPSALARAAARLPDLPGWPQIDSLARRLSDPVGNVHGLCVAGLSHAAVVRSRILDAGGKWIDDESGLPYSGYAWLRHASAHARLMAEAGPPNAASLGKRDLAALLLAGRCAMWIAPHTYGDDAGSVAVPGAAAFLVADARVIAVREKADRSVFASDLAWWLASLALPKGGGLDGSYGQRGHGQLSPEGGWQRADQAGQEALAEMVDGLVSVPEALDRARGALGG